jgi:hypothetical protein
MTRLEIVGLDGATAFVEPDQVGQTVGALRRWASTQAGLPYPSWLRLKSGSRDLACDNTPLAEVDASVQALLRLPGGTHNKYFFSGRMEAVRQKPNGGNNPQAFVHPQDPAGPHAHDCLPLVNSVDHHGNPTFNMNPMLIESIRLSDYFWDLAKQETFAQVMDQIYYNIEYVTPWVPGTHKAMRATGMQSAVRGVSNAGTPGTAYTMLLKLYYMRLTRTQVTAMINHPDSAFIKAMGFLYLRVGCLAADGFKDLWTWSAPPHRHQARRTLARAPWHRTRRCPSGPRRGRCGSPVPGRTRPCGRFEPHLDAKDALMIDGTPATATTIGQFCRRLMTDQDYFGDRLPRIPVLVQRAIDASLKEKDEGGARGARDERERGRGARDERPDERGGAGSSNWRERDARDGAERKRPAEEEAARGGAPKHARPDVAEVVRAKKEEMARLEARARELRRLIAERERAGQR